MIDMTDEGHAAEIRKAANALCARIEEACKTGLLVEASVSNYGAAWDGKHLVNQNTWRPSVTVKREVYC